MQNITLVKKCALKLYCLMCFTLVGYMMILQFDSYILNQDSSSVTNRKFNSKENDLYPTYSFCILDKGKDVSLAPTLNMFIDEPFWGDKSTTSSRWGLTSHRSLYHEMLIGFENITKKFTLINFDDVILPMEDFIKEKRTFGKSGQLHYWGKEHNNFSDSFFISYQSPDRICITHKNEFKKDLILKKDFLSLNSTKFDETGVKFEFFIHQKGKLITQIDSPLLTLTRFSRIYELSIDIRINQVDVLRKRADAVERCDYRLKDNDQMYRQAVAKQIGCIPVYWERFIFQLNLYENNTYISKCKTRDQYRKLYDEYLVSNNLEKGQNLYMQSCEYMAITSTITQSQHEEGGFDLSIYYDTKFYRVTQNNKAIDLQTLWSQIGGFIGICLGYSLLQVPDFFSNYLTWIKNVIKKKLRGQHKSISKLKNGRDYISDNPGISDIDLKATGLNAKIKELEKRMSKMEEDLVKKFKCGFIANGEKEIDIISNKQLRQKSTKMSYLGYEKEIPITKDLVTNDSDSEGQMGPIKHSHYHDAWSSRSRKPFNTYTTSRRTLPLRRTKKENKTKPTPKTFQVGRYTVDTAELFENQRK